MKITLIEDFFRKESVPDVRVQLDPEPSEGSERNEQLCQGSPQLNINDSFLCDSPQVIEASLSQGEGDQDLSRVKVTR